MQSLCPLEQASGESVAFEQAENTVKGIVRRRPIGHVEERVEPVFSLLAERFEIGPIVATTRSGQQRNCQNVEQRVVATVHQSGIYEIFHAGGDLRFEQFDSVIHDRAFPSRRSLDVSCLSRRSEDLRSTEV